jgi:hypothetical protein
MNLHHNPTNTRLLAELADTPAFIHLAGFALSGFASWAPRLYAHYIKYYRALLRSDPDIVPAFPNSVWSAATFNFGPETATVPHVDHANVPFGWCAITPLGSYDPKLGGHLVLWDCGLVIEFPPGTTALIPSSVICHSNTPIADGVRYSFTQFTAGALHGWVDRGMQTKRAFEAGASPEEKADFVSESRDRMDNGISMLSRPREVPGM